jgi:hypothetical protein
MRGPETASPSLTIRRPITCECGQHLHFSAEVSQKPLAEDVAFSEARPRCESLPPEAGAPRGYAATIAGAIASAGGAASDASLMQCSYLRTASLMQCSYLRTGLAL